MDTFAPRLDILPAAQRELWRELRPLQQLGYVLYDGTAIALRLGHRQSVDFNFFSSRPVDRQTLRQSVPFLRATEVRQDSHNTFEVATASGGKISFFGGLEFGRAGQPWQTNDGVLSVASPTDLMATKLKVILQRVEAKDFKDIAAMVKAGDRLEFGLAAAKEMFKPAFPPAKALKALVYFEGGDLQRLTVEEKSTLVGAVRRIQALPNVKLFQDLAVDVSVAAVRQSPPQASPGGKANDRAKGRGWGYSSRPGRTGYGSPRLALTALVMPPEESIASTATAETLWTVSDVARFFGCTTRHVNNLQASGLPYFYLGRLVRFDPTEVCHYLTQNRWSAATKIRRAVRRQSPQLQPVVEQKPVPQPVTVPACYY